MKSKKLRIGALALMMALPLSAATWYVRPATGSDSSPNDGSSGKPYATFAKAHAMAAPSGDIIDVSGTFTEYGKAITKSITIQGNDKTTAIFDGTAGNATMKNFSTIGRTTTGITVTIENVTFKNYNSYIPTGSAMGGVFSIQATGGNNFTFRNVVFQNNSSTYGGAIQIGGANNLTIEDCYFVGNSAKDWTNLTATPPTTTSGAGGALYLSMGASASAISVNRCLFDGNKCYGGGGSAIVYSCSATSGASLTITNSTFTGNTLKYNSAATPGVGEGAVQVNPTGTGVDVKLINNTIAYNSSARTTAGGTPGLFIRGLTNITTLINNILFSNFDSQGTPVSTSIANLTNILNKESRNNITDVAYNWTSKTTNGATMASDNVSSVTNTTLLLAASLADNGGATKTLAIGSKSVAKNAGYTIGTPTVDQRNRARVGKTDVGAINIVDVQTNKAKK